MTTTSTAHAVRDPVRLRIPSAVPLGVAGSAFLAVSSFMAGATRNRGGILEELGLGFFSYGHGRNMGMVLFWIGMVLLIGAWVVAYKQFVQPFSEDTGSHQPAAPTRTGIAGLRRALWAWIAPLAFSAPLASRDVYSYLMQGAMVRDGFDPYTQGPAVNPGPFLLEVSQDWRNTTTPYGPLHLWIGDIVTRIVDSNVVAGVIFFKALALIGFAAIAWSVPRIARCLGGDPALALWLGVCNPVLLLHLAAGMHNEALMVGIVSVALLLALRHRFHGAFILIGLGVAVKATALIAMPFAVWLAVQRFAPEKEASLLRRAGVFVLAGIWAVAEIVLALAVVTWASGTSWGWLSEITGNAKVINPLAAPTLATDAVAPITSVFFPDVTYNAVLNVFRAISTVAMLVGLVAVWWLSRRTRRSAIAGTAAAYQVAFIFNSVTLPWYYASVITVLGTFRPPRWLLKLATGASIFVALSFSADGNHQLYNFFWMLASALIGFAAAQWLFQPPRAKTPEPARGA